MTCRFRIDSVYDSQGRVYVMTRQEAGSDFGLSGSATLGGIPVEQRIMQPRKIRSDGSPDPSAFVFVLKDSADRAVIEVGSVVDLVE